MTAKKRARWKILITVVLMVLIAVLGLVKIPGLWTEVSFYWYDHTETELKVKAYAEEMGIFYAEYPQSLIELLERNPETEDFVLGYPFHEAQAYDLTGISREEVPLFLQWDSRWGYSRYGSDCIGITGCGVIN